MPDVMAHPGVGEELDLEEIVARFDEEEGGDADWSDDEGDDWGEDDDPRMRTTGTTTRVGRGRRRGLGRRGRRLG